MTGKCPNEIAERYFDSLRAPAKELGPFDRSAHLPNSEERGLFNTTTGAAKVPPIAAHRASRPSAPPE